MIGRTALALMLTASGAVAHSWYDATCCSARDCAPVPAASIVAMGDGYHVTLMPGDHPLIRWPLRTVVPYGDPRINWSQDASQHACIATGPDDYQGVLCIYVTGAGA